MLGKTEEFDDVPLLDGASPTPLYVQLQKVIQTWLGDGKLRSDEALPSERDLAKQLGISRVTVRKAIAGLVEKSILVQRWGSGTFIAPATRVEQPLSRLSSFTDDMLARGMTPSTRWLSAIWTCWTESSSLLPVTVMLVEAAVNASVMAGRMTEPLDVR